MSSRRNERKKSSISIAEPRSAAAPCGRGEAHPRATRHRCRRWEQRKFRSRHGRFSDVDLSDFKTISDKFSGGNGSSSKCLLCLLRVGDIKDVGWKYIYIWLMTKINDGFSMISLIRTLPGGAFPGWFHANFDGNSDGKVALISMMVISFSKGCMGWRTSVPSCWSYQDWTPSRNTNTQKKADVSKKSKKTALLKRTVHNFRILKGGDGNPSFHFLKAVSSFFQRNSSKAATLVFPSPPLCVQWAFLGDKNEPK